MENKKDEKVLKDGFEQHIDSLKEVYDNSDLKEKHRLNEHIKHLIKTYGQIDEDTIQKDINNGS